MAVKRFSEFRKGNDRIKVYAKGFNSNRSVQLTGNVTGSAQSDMDEGSTLSIATTIADNAVTNSKLSDGAVSTSKLQDDAVTSAKIGTGAVTVNKLGASAVETDKIANGAVTLQKISTSAIDDEPTDASDNLVTSGGVKAALDAKADKVDGATEGNLAGLDVNGNLTDSGISKDFVENAISSAGSAIQGVNVNNTTLTPDANNVVTVPLATTSADGAMSSADKTKLNNAATYTQSSGTAPVKVDANGALTPVPMDSTPTASSTNLMTSGDIKTALDTWSAQSAMYIKYANVSWTNTAGRGLLLTIKVKNYANYQVNARFDISWSTTFAKNYKAAVLDISMRRGGSDNAAVSKSIELLVRKGESVDIDFETTWDSQSSLLYVYCKSETSGYKGIRAVPNLMWDWGGPSIPLEQVTLYPYTTATTDTQKIGTDVTITKKMMPWISGETGKGSTSIPTYVNSNGAVEACTDDFVHDGDIKRSSDVSSMGTDDTHAYSGAAVSTAISNAISGNTGGFLGNKTVAEMNAYASPKMGDNAIVTDTGTITIGNTPCTVSSAPAEIRWTTDGSWVVTSSNYVNKNDVATAQALGLVKTNPTDGGVELNSNNQMVVHGWDGKASASDVTSLTTRVTSAEGDISSLQSSVAGKLNTSDAVWTIDDSDDAIIVDDDFMTWMFQA